MYDIEILYFLSEIDFTNWGEESENHRYWMVWMWKNLGQFFAFFM